MKVDEKKKEKSVLEVCPLCSSKLDRGYVASKMVAWSDRRITNLSLKGLFSGELIISRGYPYLIDNVEALRCRKCRLVIFQYDEVGSSAKGSP